MNVGYYPGCSLLGSSREFGESFRAVARALDVELAEIPDWNCCGASSAHALNHLLAVSLPANVLAKAANAKMDEIVVPCAACYSRLVSAQHEMDHHPPLKKRVEEVIGQKLDRPVRVINALQLLTRVTDRVAAKVTQPFGRTVACYYGCLLVRPAKVTGFDRTEDPISMDRLVVAAGGKTIDWSFKTECCGAGLSIAQTPTVARLAGRIVEDAVARKAEAIVVSCPMCHANLDMRRSAINEHVGKRHDIPVLFITQVIGLALGLSPKELGLRRHFVPVDVTPRLPAA
jgi:heterodisulfide reductase subunit B